jgi:hypothetical protein
MKLLDSTKPSELPTEALLARLRSRRAGIDLIDPVAAGSTEATVWVYQRLNKRLRHRLEPFFELLAMRNLTLQLRYLLAGELPATILNNSLLAKPLRQLLANSVENQALIAQLEAALVSDYPFALGLAATYREQGPGGVERQLTDSMLVDALKRSRDVPLKRTLGYLIDMRNCLMLSRLWRWQVTQPPTLTAGGSLDRNSLQRIWARHDSERLTSLAERLTGEPLKNIKIDGGVTISMEKAFLHGLTSLLRRLGRDPLGLAVIIEYLWRVELAVHNQLLRKTLSDDRDSLLEEVLLL